MKRNYFLALLFIAFSFIMLSGKDVLAQEGKVAGQVIDATTGEELIGATVQLKGSAGTGTVTDISGRYQLSLDPGTYDLIISYVSYATQTVEGVEVKGGNTTTLDVALNEENTELQEVVVTAAAIKDNDVALLKIQKSALAVQDGISSKEMSQLGLSNAAESMKQVTGAAIEDGKYVVMRGLGDRYSITQLNGITMPSADPYRNSTSMDLVPADMIDNIVTVKTYTPDQPANFTGGKVDITTKSLPDEFFMNFGVSATYNTQSSLIDNFLTDGAKGKFDWLGYDDGTRGVPQAWKDYRNQLRPVASANSLARAGRNPANVAERSIIDKTAKALDNPFIAATESAPVNYGIDFSVGNSLELFGKNFGYSLGIKYSRDYTFYNDGSYGIYFATRNTEDQLNKEQQFDVTNGSLNTQLGGLLSLAYQFSPNHELIFSNLYNHDNATEARIASGFWSSTGQPFFEDRFISYQEREMNNTQLQGKHFFENFAGLKMNWTLGYVHSMQNEPDVRLFGYNRNGDSYIMNQSEVGILPAHFYRDLTDEQYNAKIDFSLPLPGEDNNELKFGFNYSNTQRDFNELIFTQVSQQTSSLNPSYISFGQIGQENTGFTDFFSTENAGVVNTPASNGINAYGFGNYYADRTQPRNSYTGESVITAGYLMGSYNVLPRLKLVGGARVEITNLISMSKAEGGGEGSIHKTDVLPALNGIYEVNENSNIRAGVSQTLARPNMREIAPFAAVGGIAYPIILGNAALERTLIKNYDLRYEVYPRPGELFAISTYYKDFRSPIVWQLTPSGTTPEIKPVNVDQATVLGAEVEVRKSLGLISPALENFKISTNASVIYSRVDKSAEELAALANADRPNIKDWRPFQGQSPFIINASLLYISDEADWESSLSFNIWGKRLSFVTDALTPDVYEQSRPSLNFNFKKKVKDHLSVGFKANNLFNMNYLKEYDFPGDFVYESYQTGRSFSLSLTYGL